MSEDFDPYAGSRYSGIGSTGWFVGIIVALALLAIAYIVFSANSAPALPLG